MRGSAAWEFAPRVVGWGGRGSDEVGPVLQDVRVHKGIGRRRRAAWEEEEEKWHREGRGGMRNIVYGKNRSSGHGAGPAQRHGRGGGDVGGRLRASARDMV